MLKFQIELWEISTQHDDATTVLHRRNGARFPPDMTLDNQAKEFSLGFIRPDNLYGLVFCADMHRQLWDLIQKCVPFQTMANQLNLPQVDSNRVVETSQGGSMETGCT